MSDLPGIKAEIEKLPKRDFDELYIWIMAHRAVKLGLHLNITMFEFNREEPRSDSAPAESGRIP